MTDTSTKTTPALPSEARLISLTRGQFAVVDAADFDWINQWKWAASPNKGFFYARCHISPGGRKSFHVYMHRLVLGINRGDRMVADHINGNSLDNRRENLRACSTAENNRNVARRARNTSGYKGVYWHKREEKWRAGIHFLGQSIHLGYFSEKTRAALAYNDAAKQYHGEFARLNAIEDCA